MFHGGVTLMSHRMPHITRPLFPENLTCIRFKLFNKRRGRQDIVDYIEMFNNNKRRHPYMVHLSPKDFLENDVYEKSGLKKMSIFTGPRLSGYTN